MDPLGVEPVDPAKGGELDVLDSAPRSLIWPPDQLGLVERVRRLRQSIEAPIDVKWLIWDCLMLWW